MKKKTKKRIITLVALVLALGIVLAGYFVGKHLNSIEDEVVDESETVVFDMGNSIVTSMSFVNGDISLSFTFENDLWVYDGDKNYPLDQDRLSAMADTVGTVTAVATVGDENEDISVFGLDPAVMTVKASYSDNSEKTFLFGNVNSFNGAQYFIIEGDSTVYMADTVVAGAFDVDLDYLYGDETYQLMDDSLQASDVNAITITTAGGQTNEITDEDGISELFDLVYSLSLSNWEDYYADSTEMAESYGISADGDRITVKYTVESSITGDNGEMTTVDLPKEYTVYIGYKFEDAEDEDTSEVEDTTAAEEDTAAYSYFYSPEGSTVVYTIDGETVDEIFTYLAYQPKTQDTTDAQ